MKNRKPLLPLFAVIFITAVTSCGVIPVNLNYESAQMLKKGDIEIQGCVSYYQADTDRKDAYGSREQFNFGAKLGVGVNEKYNFKLRIESLRPTSFELSGNDDLLDLTEYLFEHDVFVEVDNKLRLGEYAAMSVPVGYYFNNGVFQFDPRIYISPVRTQKFDLTIIPKCHIMSDFWWGGTRAFPGISLGAGFSSDLNIWSVRTEIGYDQFSLSGGIALSYIFRNEGRFSPKVDSALR